MNTQIFTQLSNCVIFPHFLWFFFPFFSLRNKTWWISYINDASLFLDFSPVKFYPFKHSPKFLVHHSQACFHTSINMCLYINALQIFKTLYKLHTTIYCHLKHFFLLLKIMLSRFIHVDTCSFDCCGIYCMI